MADQRLQITFTNGDIFEGIVPDTLPFTSIDILPDTFQTSYCGQQWRKKDQVAAIKVEDVIVAETNAGFVWRDDPTWRIFIEALYGENGRDIFEAYEIANADSTFATGTIIFP